YSFGIFESRRIPIISSKNVYLSYENNSVVEDLNFEGFNVKATAGKQIITVSYLNCKTTFEITIKDPNAAVQYMLGDINEDSNVTTADARLALRNAVGLEKLSDIQLLAADINKNGEIETSDARMILRAAVGLEKLS
ncbi:MAG: dockerin type I repeat-containing protein, partial [Clostridia bacterium]|nr:dockerin type I repeat-containing protein [Clostridia bacterium]